MINTSIKSYISSHEISLHYGKKAILDTTSFEITQGARIGLVGVNGTGKTSVIRLLAGIERVDEGSMIVTSGVRVAYLTQGFNFGLASTVQEHLYNTSGHITVLLSQYKVSPNQELFDILTELKGFDLDRIIDYWLNRYKIPGSDQLINQLSGGQKKRLQIISALINPTEVLLLDEPTNHLDIETIQTLQTDLANYTGAVVIVSHDRQFMNDVCDHIWELDRGKIYNHIGNYQKYLSSKIARMENEATISWKTKQHLKREYKWVTAGVQARGVKDKGRLQRYWELSDQQKALAKSQIAMLIPEPSQLGSRIIDVVNLGYKIDERVLINSWSWDFQPYHKIALIGPNGAGKTTLLKLLQGHLKPTSGTIKRGINTKILYLDQHKSDLNLNTTPFEYMGNGLERIDFGLVPISTRKYLDRWLFDKTQINTPIAYLSGGQQTRLLMAKKLCAPANLLIFDEPTNDLDLDTIRSLEQTLEAYDGPVLIVSHDRSFINAICNYVLVFDGLGNIDMVTGNYDDYLEWKKDKTLETSAETPKIDPNLTLTPKQERQLKAKSHQLQKEVIQLEKSMEALQEKFNDPKIYLDVVKASKLNYQLKQLSTELDKKMTEWLEIEI
ncbi:MAG: ABC-F family ATP-binding cassette domain-containing protein [Candidatus Parcubacteria bacterium]|nr:ABC-F family ATP-binding cassette domain-containing protein [Candidatus Paceibacterota bacterium]